MGTQKLRESRFTIKPDRSQLKNTYIYFLEKWVGGYFRLDCLTHLFPTKELYSEKRWLYRYNQDNRLIDSIEADQFTFQPAFYPLELKEGLGLNITPISTYRVKLSLRGGFGFRQSFNKGVYRESDSPGKFYRVSNQFQKGFETSFLSFFALPFNISVTSELDALFPIESQSEVVIDFSNHTSWLLTRRVSLDHILRVKRDRALYSYNRVEQLVSIRLSYYLF